MVKQYASKIAVAKHCAAISNISRTWEECWESLLKGDAIFKHGDPISNDWPKTAPLSMLSDRAGWAEQPPYLLRFKTLAETVGKDMKGQVDDLLARHKDARINIIVATCHSDPGPLSTLVDYTAGVTESISDEAWQMLVRNSVTVYLNESLGRKLPVSIVSTACASALVAVSYGADLINANLTDAVLVIGMDSMARVASAGFHNIGAMAKDRCMPYDVDRTGTTVGEGAVGFMIAKEELLLPEQVYGHIIGTSVFCDAAHIVEPNPEGVRAVLQQALDQAGVGPSDITGIYWHGTGTKHNDKTESQVSELLFGELSPPCTSTKGSLGHTMGASGAYNILAACETNRSGKMIHVAPLKELEYQNLDVVRDEPRKVKAGPVLVTALGFGGINAAIVVAP